MQPQVPLWLLPDCFLLGLVFWACVLDALVQCCFQFLVYISGAISFAIPLSVRFWWFLFTFCFQPLHILGGSGRRWAVSLFFLYQRYRCFQVNYVWPWLLLWKHGLLFGTFFVSLPNSARFWLVLLAGLIPGAWESVCLKIILGMKCLLFNFLIKEDASLEAPLDEENMIGEEPEAPPFFVKPRLLKNEDHVSSIPPFLIDPKAYSSNKNVWAILFALVWALAFTASLYRLAFALFQLFRPLGRFIFGQAYAYFHFILLSCVLLISVWKVGLIPARIVVVARMVAKGTWRVVAGKASIEVALVLSSAVEICAFGRKHAKGTDELRKSTASLRASFVERLQVGPPLHFRLIDCRETMKRRKVFLVDWHQGLHYTAISHTWGQPVYCAFDCPCASTGTSKKDRYDPNLLCPRSADHLKTIEDILGMCERLGRLAGADFVWHDGVCIAQHDEEEVYDTMKHMAWVYGNANDTIIFLYYVGSPMVPVAPGQIDEGQFFFEQFAQECWQVLRPSRYYPSRTDMAKRFLPRWFDRVWTYQEALLSGKRRYCVRSGEGLSSCRTWREFDAMLKDWENDASAVKVLEEEEYVALLGKQAREMLRLTISSAMLGGEVRLKAPLATYTRLVCMRSTIEALVWPEHPSVLLFEASSRKAKHRGDRLNSMLGLAGAGDFTVRKDVETMEESTIAFLMGLGEKGLGAAMGTVNGEPKSKPWRLTWVPDVAKAARVMRMRGSDVEGWVRLEVVEGGLLRMAGRMGCVRVEVLSRRKKEQQQQQLAEGVLMMQSRILPLHSGVLWRKVRGALQEQGTCILECEQHNRLHAAPEEADCLDLMLVYSRESLSPLQQQLQQPLAFLLLADRRNGQWFKAGFLSSLTPPARDMLLRAPCSYRDLLIH